MLGQHKQAKIEIVRRASDRMLENTSNVSGHIMISFSAKESMVLAVGGLFKGRNRG
jgi:hypothetical protein